MHIPPPPFQDVTYFAQLWRVAAVEIGAYAVQGMIRLAIVAPGVTVKGPQSEPEYVSGLLSVDPAEVFKLFEGEEEVRLKRVEVPAGDHADWRFIASEADGLRVRLQDLKVKQADAQAFARAFGDEPEEESRNKGGRPTKHDWDAFYAAIPGIIFAEGVPNTLADLTRRMMDWFVDNSADPTTVPAEDHVRKRLKPVWAELKRRIDQPC